MASIEQFSSCLDSTIVKLLKDRNIKSVADFLQEKPENIAKITKLNFKDVLEIKQKLLVSFQSNFHGACSLLTKSIDNSFVLISGIEEIDTLLNGFKSGIIYEMCGLSGSGKTHTCLSLAANTAIKAKCVYYIDTKGDFSAIKLKQIISKTHSSKKDIMACLERIRVTTVYTLYEVISALHWLKNQLLYDSVPLIIIDCLSTAYFLSVGADKLIGLGLLNHIANLIKFIAIEHHVVIVITNLATKDFKNNDVVLRRNTKPCLGKYWLHVANYRLNFKKENNLIQVSLDEDSVLGDNTTCNINII
ncbi:DNA repair protein RAD51 homolog 4-like [Planococcus citri]|uniref:DNA repair protein RAD51 homolog 4-like n=1 Tax=Planococcus citri TaxID=170843 RepID=UPI0031F884AE